MKPRRTFLVIFAICLLLTSCAPKADFDIRGTWEYTIITGDGKVYDTGTITFSGEPAQGTYIQSNTYQVEYEGEYSVNGSAFKLSGALIWSGTIESADVIRGSWRNDKDNGTFTANRK